MSQQIFDPDIAFSTETMNEEEIREFTYGWNIEVHAMTKNSYAVNVKVVNTPRIQLSYIHYLNATFTEGKYPKGTVILSYFKTNGFAYAKSMQLEEHDIIFLNDKKPFDLVVNDETEIYTLAVEEKLFNEMVQSHFGDEVKVLLKHKKFVIPYPEKFLALCEHWFKDLLDSEYRTVHDHSKPEFEKNFLLGFLSCFEPADKHAIYLPKYIRDARYLIQKNITFIYTIDELAQDLDIPMRTLQYGFKHYLGFTPKEYQQYVKLGNIRKNILRAKDPNVKVGDIATKFSYFHLGHLSSEYKKVFGETPSATLRKIKEPA